MAHPSVSNHCIRFLGNGTPIEIDGADKLPPGRFPELGEHTRELMLETGFTDDEIADLAAGGTVQVLASTPD